MDLTQTIQEELMGTSNNEEKPLKVNLNGQEITFTSVDDLNRNLTEALSTVGSEYQQMKARLVELEANQGQTVQDDEPVADTGKFSQDKFLALLKENPVEAFDYVDTYRYGMEKPTEYIKTNLKQAEETRQEYEVNRWLQKHPEFPGGQYAQVLDNVRMKMNLPLTAQNLELAYQNSIQYGMIPDFKTIAVLNYQKQQLINEIQQNGGTVPPSMMPQNNQGQGQTFQPSYGQAPTFNNPAPPPRLPSGGSSGPSFNEQQMEQLSVEQIENILRKHGAL